MISFASATIASTSPPIAAFFSSSSSFLRVFSSSDMDFALSASAFLLHLSVSHTFAMVSSALFAAVRTPVPVTASIRLTPEATPPSERILKAPISPVFFTWVPPQSSTDQSPAFTTRTTAPYFSPKRAMAPVFWASSMDISVTETGRKLLMTSFTLASISAS